MSETSYVEAIGYGYELAREEIDTRDLQNKTESELLFQIQKLNERHHHLSNHIFWTLKELYSRQIIDKMPFGKHQGKPLKEVPKGYVIWLLANGRLDIKENQSLKKAFEKIYDLSEYKENKND